MNSRAQGSADTTGKDSTLSLKSKVFAAAAALTLITGVGAAGALTASSASAATPSCGSSCIDPFSFQFGTHLSPNYVLDVFRQGNKVGQPIILFRSSNDDPAEDFTVSFQGQVSDLYGLGLVSAEVELHYGAGIDLTEPLGDGFPDLYAWEVEYAPYGVDSGLCAGVASTAYSGEGVTLQPCGVSARTVWITDTENPAGFTDDYVPVINGSDDNFSQPFVLDYPHNGFPTDKPRPELYVDNLTGFSNGSILNVTGVIDTQEWGADFGALP
jgi:hypothetical protein